MLAAQLCFLPWGVLILKETAAVCKLSSNNSPSLLSPLTHNLRKHSLHVPSPHTHTHTCTHTRTLSLSHTHTNAHAHAHPHSPSLLGQSQGGLSEEMG